MRFAVLASSICSALLLLGCDSGSTTPDGSGAGSGAGANTGTAGSGTGASNNGTSGSGTGAGNSGNAGGTTSPGGAGAGGPGGGAAGSTGSGGTGSATAEPMPTQACLDRASSLLSQMSLDEKVAQTIQAEREQVTPAQITQYGIGSIYSQGGSAPTPNTPASWAAMINEYRAASRASARGIPIIYGLDSVHGLGPVAGATVFPHNIGLGAIGDAAFVEQLARVIADESNGVGADFPFAPVIAVGRDERWGRTYEAFAETTKLTSELGVAMIKGLQFPTGGSKISILANAKHYVGDGGTLMGVTGGQVTGDETALRALHLDPYRDAIAARVGSVMLSYSSWQGVPMHINKALVTDVLKGELGFGGFVLSDYNGCFQVGVSDVRESLTQCFNAGSDMLMIFGGNHNAPQPFGEGSVHTIVRGLVESGAVPMARLDDAVRRIVAVKCEMGLFDNDGAIDAAATARVGSAEHRMLARQAVQKSLVVLKNDNAVLPLAKTDKVALTGSSADNTGNLAGGWTITWQGMTGNTVPGATSVRAALEAAIGASNVIYSEGASNTAGAAVGVAVIGETPYSEGMGDRTELTVPEVQTVTALKAAGLKVVVVLVAGRPMILDPILASADAIVMAWLPGSEGAGVTDILYGDAKPSGKLPMSWPRSMSQIPINHGDASYDPLYPLGHGLTY